jgi:AcrR family transcriptional regulator
MARRAKSANVRIADAIARAGVGRSTFCEHYPNREALLAETIRMPFAPLAEAVRMRAWSELPAHRRTSGRTALKAEYSPAPPDGA